MSRETGTWMLRDLMKSPAVTAVATDSVAEAAQRMVSAKVGSVVIMQSNFLAGIMTERDVLRAAASGQDLRGSPVSQWMTPDPQSAGPETSAEDAAQMMLLLGFRHLPVVDAGRLCGVVSLRELFAARIRRPPPVG